MPRDALFEQERVLELCLPFALSSCPLRDPWASDKIPVGNQWASKLACKGILCFKVEKYHFIPLIQEIFI